MGIDMSHEQKETAQQKNHYRIAKGIIFACPIVLIALQMVPEPSRTNARVNKTETIEANLAVPAPVSAMLNRSCMNCHSNETHWPWYTRVAPVSWMVSKDVENARKVMNLSRWSSQNGRRPELAIATLTAACSGLQTGRMPKWNYVLMHPEARISKAEADQFCVWSQGEIRQLVRKRQQQSRSKFTKLLQTRNNSH
jgi:hypothetical protein